MIAKCVRTGFERKLSDQAATLNAGKFGDYVNFRCGNCENFHMGVVKGSSEYARDL